MSGSTGYKAFDHAPPSLTDIERIGKDVLAALPPIFAHHVQDVIVKVEDFPDAAIVADMGLESAYDLLGLYYGVPVGHDMGFEQPRHDVDMIFLYRRPLLAYWCDHDESFSAIVANTLIHEIGHHFGFSDDDMDRIEFANESDDTSA